MFLKETNALFSMPRYPKGPQGFSRVPNVFWGAEKFIQRSSSRPRGDPAAARNPHGRHTSGNAPSPPAQENAS
eukprot:412746-Pyramimonas_sp.AAC.1